MPPITMTLRWEGPTEHPLPKGAPLVGTTAAVCPYCGVTLAKKPSRKTKCKDCGNYIFVRTRPQDRQQVLATEADTEVIAEQWSIVNGMHDAFLAEKQLRADIRARLAAQWGKEPSEGDVEWAVLNIKSVDTMRDGDWGLFRNVRFRQAEYLRREKRLDQALEFYLEVCYLDVNGPNNNAAWNPKASWATPAPGVVAWVVSLISQLELTPEEARERFLKAAGRMSGVRMPVTPAAAWKKLVIEMAK